MSITHTNLFGISLFPAMAENEILEAIERAIAATLILDETCPIKKLDDIKDDMAIFDPDKNGGMYNVVIFSDWKWWDISKSGLFAKCLSKELNCFVHHMCCADDDDEIDACVWSKGRCSRRQGYALDCFKPG